MDRLVDVLFHRSRLIIAVWVLLTALGAVFAVGLEGRAVPGGEASSSSQAESVARELSRNGQPSLFVVVTGEAAKPGTEGARALTALRTNLADTAGVREVVALPLPPPAREAGPVTVLGLSTAGGVDASIDVARRILDTEGLAPRGSEAFLGGYGAHREELVELSRSDLLRAEKVGVPIVIVVLLLTFGSVAATVVPLAIGLAALAGGLGAAGALAFGVPFSEYVTNAAAMVGLALAVDYAMFLVQRVREALLDGTDVDQAVRGAMRTTGVAIAWSGVTVLAAQATMLLVDARSIRTAALGMMLVTLCALAAALIAAPLILRSLGYRLLRQAERAKVRNTTGLAVGPAHRADRFDSALSAFRRSRISRSHRRGGELSGFWGRWGEQMTTRPGLWLTVGTLLLAVLCIPAFGIGQRVDLPTADAMPADSQVRQASEIGAKSFGPGVLSPVEIVVHSTPGTVERDARRVADVLRDDPEVRSVNLLPLQDAYRVSVATTHGPAHDRTEALVASLRDGKLHESLSGVRYQVGGESAMRLDAKVALFESLPLMIGVLLVLVLVLFMMAMRSIVLALKGMVLVVISLGASAGGLLLLSTTELGAQLIGWSQPQDLHPIVPVTIVALAVALSTDYEVILISRIAEVYRKTRDNTHAIIHGVAHTGRVISSAAAIMIAVFFGFALSDVTPLRQLGVGLAFAVLIDATLIRGVLVPAAMQLMGRWNWWFPSVRLPLPLPLRPGGRVLEPKPHVAMVRSAVAVGPGSSE